MNELTARELICAKVEMCKEHGRCADDCVFLGILCDTPINASNEATDKVIDAVNKWRENKPFKPRMNENYWGLNIVATKELIEIVADTFEGTLMDLLYLNAGLCYRTKEAAEANAEADWKRLRGDE